MSENWDEKRKILREQAETLLAKKAFSGPGVAPEMKRVIHDLSVHQIELELQNEELLRTQQQVEAARDGYMRLYHQAPVGYLSLDVNGLILQTNQTFADMLGLEPGQVVGKTLADFISPADRQIFLGRFRAFFNHPLGKSVDVRLKRHLKTTSKELITRLTGRIEAGTSLSGREQPNHLLVIVSDVTAQKATEDALRDSEALFRLAFENANVGMCLINLEGNFIKVNHQMREMFGYSRAELEQLNVNDITHPDYKDVTMSLLKRSVAGEMEHFSYEKQYFHKAGHILWGQISSSLVRDNQGRPHYFISHVQDITERKRAELALYQAKEELEQKNEALHQAFIREQLLARTDALTGINNRRYFYEVAVHEFGAAVRYAHPLTIIMFDIDNFKHFNDAFGHQAGDEMLRGIAQIAKKQLRDADIMARYGGEEFIILLPHTNGHQAYLVAERIRQLIGNFRLSTATDEIGATVSLGVAEFMPETDDELDKLIHRADTAMYAAKNSGRDSTRMFAE